MLRDAFISAAHSIANQKKSVDELNVFPVPDGDTGTNMSMTMGNALPELDKMKDTVECSEVAKTMASALLRGARGNSGVITSLIFRGFSKALSGKKKMSAEDLVVSLENGVAGAYKSVMKPTEGTILTVVRESAEKARETLRSTNDPCVIMDEVCAQAARSLEETPKLLIMLIGKTTTSHREYRWSREVAEAKGIPFINFIRHYPNRVDYIRQRLHKYL